MSVINEDSEVPGPPIEMSKKNQNNWKRFWNWVITLVVALLIILTFRSICFEPYRIPSGSMLPTLKVGDFILANKFSYGWKVPFSDWFGDPLYMTSPRMPQRGDVIVFKYPKDLSMNYIKRVIALPGESVEVTDKVVYINDIPIKMAAIDGTVFGDDLDDKYKMYNFQYYSVENGEMRHTMQVDQDNWYQKDFSRRVVPAGHVFVMGDNRDFSYDSRNWGFVPFGYIKGRAILVWFSMILPFGDEEFKMRPGRMFTVIN